MIADLFGPSIKERRPEFPAINWLRFRLRRRDFIILLGGAAIVLFTTSAALAHHAFAAEYDWKKPVTITGSVTKVDWTNPHTLVYVRTLTSIG